MSRNQHHTDRDLPAPSWNPFAVDGAGTDTDPTGTTAPADPPQATPDEGTTGRLGDPFSVL
ncbi:hypothetical protein [Longispora urticae]